MSRFHVLLLAVVGSMLYIDTLFRHSRLRHGSDSSRGGGGGAGWSFFMRNNNKGKYRSLDNSITFDDTIGIAAQSRLRKTPFLKLSDHYEDNEDGIVLVDNDDTIEEDEKHRPTNNATVKKSTNANLSSQPRPIATKATRQNTKAVIEQQQQSTPQIAWLLSYPNSGTSFTLKLVQKASNRAVASNYGSPESTFLNPLHLKPPFWEGPSELPSTYLLTQTHCGGCHDCRQKQNSAAVVPTRESFLMDCSYSYKNTPSGKKIAISYSPDLVGKAVHLVRNPFHNIAAKFQRVQRLTSEYHKTAAGFRKWCKDNDQNADGGRGELYEKLKSVPCHSELFKYVQWHNLAHETLQSLKVPYTTVHYEMYANETQGGTISSLLEFLELVPSEEELVVEPFVQKAMSEYDSYFPDHQIDAITYFVQKLSSPETWKDVKDYFPAPSLLQSSIISIALRPQDMKTKINDVTATNWIASIDEALDNPKNLDGMWVQ